MKITWLVFGHQPDVNTEAPLLGEIKLNVPDDKHKHITFQRAHDLAKKHYGQAFGYVARKSRVEYHQNNPRGERTITIYE